MIKRSAVAKRFTRAKRSSITNAVFSGASTSSGRAWPGYKLFFVSAQGNSGSAARHMDKHIMDVTLNDLYANYRKKSCQEGCGVYCAVSDSLLVEKLCSGSREGK